MKNIFYLQYLKLEILKLIGESNSKIFLRFAVVLFFLFTGFVGNSQVTVKIDTNKIRIGEQFQYEIIVNETKDVQFLKLKLDSLKRIGIVKSHKIDSLKDRLIKKYTLTSFDSGRYVLPSQTVLIRNKAFLTDSFFVDVATVAVDTIKQPLHHIKSINKEPYTFADFQMYFWGLLLLIAIAVILYFVLKDKPTHEEIISRIPPFDLAKQRLQELDSRELLKQNRVKLYYVELTDIVRSYIERELNIPALESTTDELMETISDFNSSSNLNIPKETLLKLKELLREADLVKFAKSKPLPNEIELHRNDAETIIDKMHPTLEIVKPEKESDG